MPIYKYICDDCGEHYERIVMSRSAKITCPKCASAKSTIQLSVFAAPASGKKSSGVVHPRLPRAAVVAAAPAAATGIWSLNRYCLTLADCLLPLSPWLTPLKALRRMPAGSEPANHEANPQGHRVGSDCACGGSALAAIAFERREPLNAVWFVIASVCTYLVAYRFYSAFLAAKIFALDDSRATPAERLEDGRDFVPTNKWVLLGHHFAAIAGPGPLVGPRLRHSSATCREHCG